MHKVDFFRASSRFEIGWVFPWLISASSLISISILTPWLSGCLHPPAFQSPCQLLDANRNLTAKSPLAWPHARIASTLEKTVFAMHGGRPGREGTKVYNFDIASPFSRRLDSEGFTKGLGAATAMLDYWTIP